MDSLILTLDSTAWSAVFTLGQALIAVLLFRVSRNQSISASLSIQHELLSKLDSPDLRLIRRQRASTDGNFICSQDDVTDLLTAIEHIATAVRRNAIDFRSVWSSSLGDVIYFHIDESLGEIREMRKNEPTFYEDLLWYRRKATRMVRRRRILARLSGLVHKRSNCKRSKYREMIRSTRIVESELLD